MNSSLSSWGAGGGGGGSSCSATATAATAGARTHMFALTTKQRPSTATVRSSGSHVSRPSAVGARYKLTFCAYSACRTSGM